MDEADLIPLSALQHMLYCPRQCALIHVEQVWSENRFTAEGRILHDKADQPGVSRRRVVRTATAMPIRSTALGVSGVADVVELYERDRRIHPFPVEYKRGSPKAHRADEAQLCAQGIALEEMFGVEVPEGALFYGETRRRVAVVFDADLRRLTEQVAASARDMILAAEVPHAAYEAKRCRACSLLEMCAPRETADGGKVARWIERMIGE
ncbi:CRISPR-associated protein Cas4 [Methylosinus sp. RM1]|uniref:CRISPR-associated protein Cas4 n=1 Tax=Methylosinus sp. RM1 TaxID=2583817 RepID=UPI0014087559|nr:CRISPR-associated protein Cas4 [Methylosinus sp. RM1]